VINTVSTGNVNIHHETDDGVLGSVTEHVTADLAISGTSHDTFANVACSVTLPNTPSSVSWWMFTFPVDTVLITNVKINYRSESKSSCQ
jgi:hypothetical protein